MSAARYAVRVARRGLATAAAHPTTASAAASSAPRAAIPLANLEAQWERMSNEEQVAVHEQLEELQKKNWKELSLAEKKAAYYVSFGPHGPRAPINPPGTTLKVALGVTGLLAATGVVWFTTRSLAPPPPKTMSKEWQEASNERAKEMRINPISGISSEEYKGKGFVTEDK
ncbi:unnamed protein product [Peniophora sp. CBMAI 1063]|nr:unnamed protein product [Peniophora sp. CBMAI 1063]